MFRLRLCQELLGAMRLASIGCLLAAGTAAAQAVDDEGVSRGHELAGQLCSGCHVVDPRQSGVASDGVPTFMSVAAELDDAAIENRLLLPNHPAMPSAPLDREQRQDVIAYIRSLAAD